MVNRNAPYTVGYAKPPLKTRFAKGRSGNPRGRPRGRDGIKEVIAKALQAKVTVTEGGRRVQRSKLAIALTQIANKAASGDHRAIRLILDLLPYLENADTTVQSKPDLAADREQGRKLIERLLSSKKDRHNAE